MGLQSFLASMGGDIWASARMAALWPYPAVLLGVHGLPGERFTEDDYRFFTRVLQPGDMLVTRTCGFFLSNNAIPGAFKHLAVYVGAVSGARDQKTSYIAKPRSLGLGYKHTGAAGAGIRERCIVHAVSDGVVCQDVLKLLFHADYAGIIRPWQHAAEQAAIVKAAITRVGLPYNFDFTPKGPPASYCTELGNFCLTATRNPPPTSLITVSMWGGKAQVPLADDFAGHFGLVACSKSCADVGFYKRARNDRIREVVQGARDFDDLG
jgi:hypothetical protein